MIQFNLLPDVKQAYIKAKRRKHLIVTSCSSVIGVCLLILALLFGYVNFGQKQHLNALSKDINAQVKNLQDTQDLDKILTVQNQLSVLSSLHDDKPVASRLFTYLTQTTPSEISISKLDVDFQAHTMKVSGSSSTLNNVNQFADTLKFTDYTKGDDEAKQKAFSDVVLSSFGRTETAANFAIDLTFDPLIFDSSEEVKLVVPSTVTTRSEIEKPVFEATENQ